MVKGHWSETDKRHTRRQAGKDRVTDRETKWAENRKRNGGMGKEGGGKEEEKRRT